MIVHCFSDVSQPLPRDNSIVHRFNSHADFLTWLRKYAGAENVFEITTVLPSDGNFLDLPLSFLQKPDYVVIEYGEYYFCYFVTDTQIVAENVMRIFVELDAWATLYGIGENIDTKYGRCHVIQGHYGQTAFSGVPAVDIINSDFDFFDPALTADNKLRKSYIFPNYYSTKNVTPVFVFAGENRYYTIFGADDLTYAPKVTKTYAYEIYGKLARINKFKKTGEGGEEYNLNSVVAVYFVPSDIFFGDIDYSIKDDFGELVYLNDGTHSVAYGRLVNYNQVTTTFGGQTALHVYGASHFIQIGTKVFNLPENGKKSHNFRVNSVISQNGIKIYCTVDEQTEEITNEFSLPVYSDTVANFWNQNTASVALQMTASAIGAVGSIATGNVIGAVGSTLAIGQQTAQILSRLKQPCKISGSPSFQFADSPQLQCGAEFCVAATNQASVVSDINERGLAVNYWLEDLRISDPPTFPLINSNGVEVTTAEGVVYTKKKFVQVDSLVLRPSYCPPQAVDRLRTAFFNGVTIHYENK